MLMPCPVVQPKIRPTDMAGAPEQGQPLPGVRGGGAGGGSDQLYQETSTVFVRMHFLIVD